MYNALIPADTTNWGGHGFSYHAIVYDLIGWAGAFILDLIVPPHIRPYDDNDAAEEEEDQEKYNYEE